MAGPEFFQTLMGKRFFESTMPRIADALEALAKRPPDPVATGVFQDDGFTFNTYETYVEYEQANRDELATTLGCGNSWREIQLAASKAVKNDRKKPVNQYKEAV